MNKYLISQMTLDEMIGQLFYVGFDSLAVNQKLINLVNDCKIGNFILFSRNINNPRQLFELTKGLHALADFTLGIVPFINIDQEGGMVTRIQHQLAFYPGAMTLAATNDPHNAYLTGKYMGEDLSSLGINMNLAPVLDVNINPFNPVIGVRSYSDDPNKVIEYGLNFIKGLQEFVIASGKHFPGHGDTTVDSHLSLPTIKVSRDRFYQVELNPFKIAIQSGLKAIMSSHVNYIGITEDNLPATLSKKCLTGLLREELHFEGLILTDCMEMKAIQTNYSTKEGALMAILAGANLVGISHTESLQRAAFNRIKEAVSTGELPMEILTERVTRILEYKNALPSWDYSKEYETIEEIVENKMKLDFCRKTVASALTLVKGNIFKKNGRGLLIAFEPGLTSIVDESGFRNDIVAIINNLNFGFEAIKLPMTDFSLLTEDLLKSISNYDQIVICEYNSNQYLEQAALIDLIAQLGKDVHVFSMRNPYVLFSTKYVQNYVCFYEYTPNSLKALVQYIKGEIKPRGKVPVHYE